MKKEKKSFKKHFRHILLAMFSTLIGFVLFSCEKEDPNPPVQPMYGVQAVEFEDVNTDN